MPMVHSSDDMLAFVAELNVRRMQMVLSKRARRLGCVFLANGSMDHHLSERQVALITLARKLHMRFMRGNYQHEESELSALNELAWWLIDEHRQNGDPVGGTFTGLQPSNMQQLVPLPRGRYEMHIARVGRD